jgi:hypothetical protein
MKGMRSSCASARRRRAWVQGALLRIADKRKREASLLSINSGVKIEDAVLTGPEVAQRPEEKEAAN